MIRASAPGKLILFGEHACVYGELAIATAVNKRAYVTACELPEQKILIESKGREGTIEASLNAPTDDPIVRAVQESLRKAKKRIGIGIEIDSKIPIGVGMGSSASVSTAAGAAVLGMLKGEIDPIEVNDVAYEAEKVLHGTPSGISNTITTFGGTIAFKKENVEPLETDELSIVVGNTGILGNKSEQAAGVKRNVSDPRVAHSIFYIGSIATKAKRELLNKNYREVGHLMDKNHELLRKLGVSSPKLERLVKAAKEAGAFGAKLTGAGGGGCIIALTDDPEGVINALEEEGANAFQVQTNQEGARVES